MSNEDLLQQQLEEAKRELDFEKVITRSQKKEIEGLRKATISINKQVYKGLLSFVMNDLKVTTHRFEERQNQILCVVAHLLDSKRFPLTGEEREMILELLKDGYEAELDSLKDDKEKAKETMEESQ